MTIKRTKSGRFAKGSSGNPGGGSKRLQDRRKPESVEEGILDVLREEVDIISGGQRRRLPKHKMVITRLVNDAMNGKVSAQKILLPFVAKLSLNAPGKDGIDFGEEVRRKLREMHERIEEERQREVEEVNRVSDHEDDENSGPVTT